MNNLFEMLVTDFFIEKVNSHQHEEKKSPIAQNCHHHKVINIMLSPTSLEPICLASKVQKNILNATHLLNSRFFRSLLETQHV